MPSPNENEVKIIKIAVISDAHGNLPALWAVIDDIKREDCEKIYHLGDAIAIGAYPAEVMESLMHNNVQLIMGNHEEFFLSQPNVKQESMSEGEFTHQKWVSDALSRLHRRIISNSPYRYDEIINGYRLSFMHYALSSDTESEKKFSRYVKKLSDDNIDEVFGDIKADIVFFGHMHTTLNLTGKSGVKYINPGSLGCQKDDLADYCIVTISNGIYKIDFKKIKYDKITAIEELDNRNVPDREFIKRVFYGVE